MMTLSLGILGRDLRSSVTAFAALLALNTAATVDAAAQTKPPAKGTKSADAPKAKKADTDTTPKAPKLPDAPLFKSESIVEATLAANYKAVRKDKGETAPWHAATISYADTSAPGGKRVVPLRVRTRGIWRLKNCDFPPLRFNFVNKEAKGSLFHDLDEPKLVSYCKNTTTYEQYVLQEFQLYRIYRLLTPISHQVRLLRMSYADSATGKVESTHFAFIVEDPQHVAARAGGKILKSQGAMPEDLQPETATISYLFQYMIGNTDFSISGLHNAELIALPNGTNLPIAYDFDFSGAVGATYAAPDVSLPIRSVRDRLYRGFCSENAEVTRLLPLFQQKKAAIYALYSDALGQLMAPRVVKETLAYFDDFYDTIGNPKDVERKILKECRKQK